MTEQTKSQQRILRPFSVSIPSNWSIQKDTISYLRNDTGTIKFVVARGNLDGTDCILKEDRYPRAEVYILEDLKASSIETGVGTFFYFRKGTLADGNDNYVICGPPTESNNAYSTLTAFGSFEFEVSSNITKADFQTIEQIFQSIEPIKD